MTSTLCHPKCPKCHVTATHEYSGPVGEYGVEFVRCGNCRAVIGVVLSETLKRASERKLLAATG
jgi:hypothetical protein